jgi:nucleoside-diphosphate-sugar epimerase
MEKILVIGGSGFIGTNLINYLGSKAVDILNLDINDPKIEGHKTYWKKVDICDKECLEQSIFEFSPDYIIHLAARTDLNGGSLGDYSANIEGITNLLEVLDSVSSLKRVVFTSSMYVCEPGYKPENFEDYNPHTIYGESKVLTEKLIKDKNPSYTWSIIRPTSIWGPYFGEPYDLFFKIVLGRKYFHMGEKACRKTYGYIDNFIYQLFCVIDAKEEDIHMKVFYLGDYEPYDITEWSNEIAEIEGFKIPNVPYFVFQLAGWFGDLLKTVSIRFPMTSFRLKNMTTDNVHDLSLIKKIAPNLPVSRKRGTINTIKWVKSQK